MQPCILGYLFCLIGVPKFTRVLTWFDSGYKPLFKECLAHSLVHPTHFNVHPTYYVVYPTPGIQRKVGVVVESERDCEFFKLELARVSLLIKGERSIL